MIFTLFCRNFDDFDKFWTFFKEVRTESPYWGRTSRVSKVTFTVFWRNFDVFAKFWTFFKEVRTEPPYWGRTGASWSPPRPRESNENLLKIYRKSIENLSKIYRKSIENLSKIYEMVAYFEATLGHFGVTLGLNLGHQGDFGALCEPFRRRKALDGTCDGYM